MRSYRLATLVLAAVAGSTAVAQDYGDRNDTPITKENSAVTANISGFGGGDWIVLNSGGNVVVPKSSFDDPEFVSLGNISLDGGDHDVVEAAWWEVFLPDGRFVQMVFRTQTGAQMVPFGAMKDGVDLAAYTYEMGADGNGLDYRQWVTEVYWRELQVSYSGDGGQTVFSDPTIHDPAGDGPWGGTDNLHLGLAFPGDGVNWIQASYRLEAVPAPATALVLLGPAGILASRRRR